MVPELDRARARRISIFNHKGGVGKTTLTMNIGSALSDMGKRVLLVDADPQCNLTSYLVDGDVVDDLLDHSDGPEGRTIWTAVKPISEAMGEVFIVKPIELSVAGMHLVAGDIRLSEFESDLNEFWAQCLQRKARGFRGTSAISGLVNELCRSFDFDYVLYDSGPNIGPLNRAVLLDCDEFIVPVACDLFSLRALKTLGRTLIDWISSWQTIGDLAPPAMPLLPGRPSFAGYIPGGFRTYGGKPASKPQQFMAEIEKEIDSQVVRVLARHDPALVRSGLDHKLGEVQDLGALVPASQEIGAPLYDDLRVGSPAQRAAARKAFKDIAERIDGDSPGSGA